MAYNFINVMRLNRFFTNQELNRPLILITDKEQVNQIKNVFRLKIGAKLVFFDGKKNEVIGKIKNLTKNNIEIEIVEIRTRQDESPIKTSLYLAILKKENFELASQKATEVGIKEIVPIITKRTIKTNLNFDRLEKILKEAAEQSHRKLVPTLSETLTFEEGLSRISNSDLNFFLDISGNKPPIVLPKQNINAFVGPEGGWDKSEVELAKEKKFKIIKISRFNLRAETAAIVAAHLIS